MGQLTLLAPAKLNLFLHINGRRSDGYHLLQTVFQLLDYGDELELSSNSSGNVSLSPSIPGVALEDNLIYRAAILLQQHTGCTLGADIKLSKRLPMGGGIGGGSSDAATTLVGLNHLWQTQLNKNQLQQLGQQLGADVPVFIGAQSACAEGIGEQLQAIEIEQKWYVVLKPNCHVSTAEIFSNKRLTRDTPAIKVAAFLEQGNRNDCQAVVEMLYPKVSFALNWLEQFAPAKMTGTGACVFSAFSNKADAENVLSQRPDNFDGFVAKGINQSPLWFYLSS